MDVRIGGPFKVTDQMKGNVAQVLESGRLSPGPLVSEFEHKFADYHGTGQGVMTNSGTSALVVALQGLKEIGEWEDEAEVIVPAITFVATVNAVLHCNLKPVLVDVEAHTYTIDTDQIEAAITPKTKVIIPVHTFGLPAEMVNIQKLASIFNLKVIEDACEALGATYNTQLVGALGDVGCFSFYMSHHINAGVGGMVISGNPWITRKIRSLVNHGWERDYAPMDASTSTFDLDEIKKRYYFTSIGHSFRATEFEAAIALPQLETLQENVARRVENAKTLTAGLGKYIDRLQLPRCPYNRSHSLMMYPIILKEGDKWDLIHHLEINGIETREMLPLTNQPCYQGLFNEDDYPIAKWINEQGFYVGCSQYLTDDHMSYVVEKFGEWVK